MALHLIYGRSGSGKTTYCLNQLIEKLRAGGNAPLLWLLPEYETFKMEKLLAQSLPEQGFSRAYVLGFKRFSYRVLDECGGALCEHITELGKRLLLSRILHEHRREWSAFARASRKRGFADILNRLLEELKIYGVDAAVLRAKAQELKDSDDLKAKLLDLALAYEALEEKKAGVYQDKEDCMAALIKKLPQSKLIKNSHVYIDGFRFFNPQEMAVIRVLLEQAVDVTVTLCLDDAGNKRHGDETDLFYRQYRMRQQLLKMAVDCCTETDEMELGMPHRFRKSALAHIEAALYRFNAPQLSDCAGVRLFEAANQRREIEGIAADILRQRREEKLRWRDIALLVRDGDSYYAWIETVFQAYEIPYFNERKMQTLHHPLAELLRSALEAINGWNYEPLFRVFKTGFFPAERSEIDLLENYVLACGIRGKKWLDEAPWSYQPGHTVGFCGRESAQELLLKMDALRRRIAAPLVHLHDKIKKAATFSMGLAALYELLEELDAALLLEREALAAEEAGRLAEAAGGRQVWEGVMTLLEQLNDISGDEPFEQDMLAQLLEDGLDELTISLIPPGIDFVTVADFDKNSAANLPAVYIVGVHDGVIPRKAKIEGLLTDSDRFKLAQLGVDLPAGISADNFGERYFIYSAFTRATDYLTISYALADPNGDALLPSALLERLRELLPLKTKVFALEASLAGADILGKPRRSLAYLSEVFSQARLAEHKVPELWQAVYNWGLEHGMADLVFRYLAGFSQAPSQSRLAASLAKELYLDNKRLRGSVTRFEAFRRCPFRHFADYGLALKERTVFSWQVNELGSFLHLVLKRFGERLHAASCQWGEVSETQCRQLCHELVLEIAPELKNQILFSSAYYQHLLQRIEQAAVKSLLRLIRLAKDGAFKPIGYEKSFGHGKELAPLTYHLPDGSVLEVSGQIDRIDSCQVDEGQYLVIIDYKTGVIQLNLLEVYYGLKMQLLTYLLVACNAFRSSNGDKAIPAGVLYCFLKTQKLSLSGRCLAAEVEHEIDKALKMPGWVLADKEIIRKFDALGRFLPVTLDRKGEFTKASVKYIKTPAEFTALLRYIDKILADTGEQILSGDIAVSPSQLSDRSACTYCLYGAICRFDAAAGEGGRLLPKLSEEEILTRICTAVGEGKIDE